MSGFNPQKLHVSFSNKLNPGNSILSRKYTLTHSDKTGDLFLSIGPSFDHKKFSGLYSKLMRDEVLGEWQNVDQAILVLRCLVSGGIAIGPAKWRKSIFKKHMKMVLMAICYGDRSFIAENEDLLEAPVYVDFITRKKGSDSMEKWGIIKDFIPH